MKKKEWNEGLDHLDPDLVEKYALQKEKLREKNKKHKSIWLRFGAIAVGFVLILGAVIVVPMLRDIPGVIPYKPNEEPWSPIITPNVSNVVLSADEVNSVFDVMQDNAATNQYTKIYTSDPKYLNLSPLPIAEYLPVYSARDFTMSKVDLQDFINEYIDEVSTFFGIESKEYEIEKDVRWNGDPIYEAEISEGKMGVRFIMRNNLLYFDNYSIGEKRLKINGSMISILESDTITYICASFGKDYSDVKISREYSYEQLRTITIYLYSPEKTIFPSNFSKSPMTSDYISLTFFTDWGSGTSCDWGGSDDEAFLSSVSLYQTLKNWNQYFSVVSKVKMLTLEEAEELLAKGYVFGGHSCPLCMAVQPEVDFSDYTFVDVEYVSDENEKLCIPFYAFYKYIGNYNGMDKYAKTYVPAFQASGYAEYFANQEDDHGKGFAPDIVD